MYTITVLDTSDLVEWRRRRGLSMYQAADLFKVSQSQWWKLENGRAEPPRHFYNLMQEIEAQLDVKAMVAQEAAMEASTARLAEKEKRQSATDARFAKQRDEARQREADEERSQRLADLRRQIAEVEDKAIDGLDVQAFLSAME